MDIQTKIRATAEYLRGIRLPACEAKASTMICAAAVELDKIAKEAEGNAAEDEQGRNADGAVG